MEGDVIITQDLLRYDIEGEDAERQASSAGTSRPASAGRISGTAPAITARTSGSPRRSTRWKSGVIGRKRLRMFGIDITVLAIIVLAGLQRPARSPMAFLFTRIENEKKAGKPRRQGQDGRNRSDQGQGCARPRRRDGQAPEVGAGFAEGTREASSTKSRQEVKKPPLKIRLRQAGLQDLGRAQFYIASSVICGIALTALAYFVGAPLPIVPGVLLVGRLGLPRWFVKFRRASAACKAFLNEFPNALDVIVRADQVGPAAQRRASG